MDSKKFTLWNRVSAVAVLVVSALTYLSTIEPTASFWDCGEFIASSYKLEVGHPPGNPVFQLIARFFTLFTNASHAAVAVNVMSALCSALTIFFLYLTIVFFAKRLVGKKEYSTGQAIAIIGSGVVGALAYTFSDTFWFSAVEAEVYAMSSMFTAMVVWAMTRWYDQADEPYSGRWIVLISFLMGLSIGVHLLNLLAIPMLVFMYFYRKREQGHYTGWDYVKIFLLSVVLLAAILFFIVPWLPKLAAYTDILFVNVFGLGVNSGAAFFLVALLAACFYGLYKFYRQNKVLLTTITLCFTTIVIGFSIFSIIIIRSQVMPPTNENQPDNAFSLVRYLSREQYGSAPLLYGPYYGASASALDRPQYWVLLNGKYKKVQGPLSGEYDSSMKMLFPRMWSNQSDRHISLYEEYNEGKGTPVSGTKYRKPTFWTNLYFFFDYQVNWMYWRYFMWNFAGRQNEFCGTTPGDPYFGNWECGIGFIDGIRLRSQADAPAVLRENKGKNHYFLLPLLLGLIGLFFQFDRDKRGCWLTFLLFFMTGIAIVLYINQSPYQVRERDYAYAGSFYAFSIWIGLGVAALSEILSKGSKTLTASAVSVLCLGVPALMAQQNWDDHDRSNRYTSVEMARNYLNSVGPNGVLVTHGDNDTFPLWYTQEVEGVRPDVRIANTSLLGTDWHIGQMKYAINDAPAIPLTVPAEQYLYGTNEWIPIYDTRDKVIPIKDVIAVFKHPDAKLALESGSKVDYIVSRKISIPVNKANVLKSGILPQAFADSIPDQIVISIPKEKDAITKPELFMLDMLSTYQWDRPINLLSLGGDINIGIKDYLMYEGFSSKLVPIRCRRSGSSVGVTDLDALYEKMTKVYKWDALSRTDYLVDYQNLYTFLGVLPQRELFINTAKLLLDAGRTQEAEDMIDRCQKAVPQTNFPLESVCIGLYGDASVIGMIDVYLKTGAKDKAFSLMEKFMDELTVSMSFYIENYDYSKSEFEMCCNYLYFLADTLKQDGEKDKAAELMKRLEDLISVDE